MIRAFSVILLVVLPLCLPLHAQESEYEVGGPLAGLKLPLAPTEHGAPPGHPGSIPKLAAKAKAEILADPEKAEDFTDLKAPFTPVGQYPELELYPGSVEHWRAYMFKYMPVRSLFDRQSQLKNWVAPAIPGTTAAQQATYAEPISWVPRWGHHMPTGLKATAVPVVKLAPGHAPLTLACGTLPIGSYVVRIIGAVPTEAISYFRQDLFIRMTVNDGLKGETSTYLKRAGYTDQFYSMSELFFQVTSEREVTVTLQVDATSKVELLVHSISLDDCLAGHEFRVIKKKPTLHPGKGEALVAAIKPESAIAPGDEERWRRDAWLWQSFPHNNAQGNQPYRFPKSVAQGAEGKSAKEITSEYGSWTSVLYKRQNQPFNGTPEDIDVFLVNHKLGLTYTVADHLAGRPLPGPYPYADNGTALTYPDPADPTKGQYHAPIATAVSKIFWEYPEVSHASVRMWEKRGEERYARDAALSFIRWAYAFPTLVSQARYLDNQIAEYGSVGRSGRFHRRLTTSRFYRWYTMYGTQELDDYDLLYPYIKGNQDLADSVNRFVPWVKTPDDVIKLIDTYMMQSTAKRILRYNWHTGEMKISRLAALMGDNTLTDPWMDWLFAKTFVYPLPVAGIGDLMITGTSREGTEYVASSYYAGGENAIPKAAELVEYIKAGGNKIYDLSDPERYPKPVASTYWLMERHVAGLNHVRIGDVTGPDKYYGSLHTGLNMASTWGWRWTKDPRFAYMLDHYFTPEGMSDEELTAIKAASATVKRAPWLDQPSRVMPQWATVLETGREHDDHRFRRALALRMGMGWGHHHHDVLDLQVWAHGTMMTCDGGQRPSYSRPADRSTRMHNTVEVDGLNEQGGEWLGHSWTRSLSDHPESKYTRAEAEPPHEFPQVTHYERQTALLDVDEGQGSTRLTHEQHLPKATLPAGVTTPNSYVFDVVRVSGGKLHTYSFHGNRSDVVMQNMTNPVEFEALPEQDQAYIRRMAGERLGGDAPEHLQVTFKLEDSQVQRDLGKNFDASAGPWFTRLHMVGEEGARVLRGSLDCIKWKYQIPMTFVQRQAAEGQDSLDSAFAAIIEPYASKPFITDIKRVPIANNSPGAEQAVALTVTTTNGHTDLCFSDSSSAVARSVGEATVQGEFAWVSQANGALRAATLTGGKLLQTPQVLIRPATDAYVGTIAQVDYPSKTITLDQPWPAVNGATQPFIFEVGTGNHWTTYTATRVAGHKVTVQRGADYYRAQIKKYDEATNTVYCALSFGSGIEGITPSAGIDKHWVATNDDASTSWRADYLGGDRSTAQFGFKLTGVPANPEAFGKAGVLRLWEYGAGDSVRHTTSTALNRQADGTLLLTTDVDVQVGLVGNTIEAQVGGVWKALPAKTEGPFKVVTIALTDCADGKLTLRLK